MEKYGSEKTLNLDTFYTVLSYRELEIIVLIVLGKVSSIFCHLVLSPITIYQRNQFL